MRINYEGDMIHAVFDILLPVKCSYSQSDAASKMERRERRIKDALGHIRQEMEEPLHSFLSDNLFKLLASPDTGYVMVYCSYIHEDSPGKIQDLYTDTDNIHTESVTNYFIKSLNFVPDDNPYYITTYVCSCLNGQSRSSWLVSREAEEYRDRSHTELFIVPFPQMGEIFK